MSAKEEAEGAGCHADAEECQPLGIESFPCHLLDGHHLIPVDEIGLIARQCVPAELVGEKRRHHVDAVLVAFAEHGFRRDAVIHIDHDSAVCDVDLDVFPVNAKVSGGAEPMSLTTRLLLAPFSIMSCPMSRMSCILSLTVSSALSDFLYKRHHL